MRPGVVFIAEEEDTVFPDHFLTGRFGGYLDGGDRVGGSFEALPLDEALAWARERADRIVLRVGHSDVYAVGFDSGDAMPWPDGGIEPPVRRRVPDEAWKDRTDSDPDADWTVTVELTPPGRGERREPAWDAVVEAVAAELGASWSAESIDGWLADMRDAARRSPTGDAGWTTTFTRAYEVACPSARRPRRGPARPWTYRRSRRAGRPASRWSSAAARPRRVLAHDRPGAPDRRGRAHGRGAARRAARGRARGGVARRSRGLVRAP